MHIYVCMYVLVHTCACDDTRVGDNIWESFSPCTTWVLGMELRVDGEWAQQALFNIQICLKDGCLLGQCKLNCQKHYVSSRATTFELSRSLLIKEIPESEVRLGNVYVY